MTRASKTWVASSGVMVANTSGLIAVSNACSGVMLGGIVDVLVGMGEGNVGSGMGGCVVSGTDVLDIVVVVEGAAVDVVVV
jgi:hypothetical protein